jgi:four helix bundle protein
MLEFKIIDFYIFRKNFMSITHSLRDLATEKAEKLHNEINILAKSLNNDDLYQLKSRMLSAVMNLNYFVESAFDKVSRLERIRSFVTISGKMQECKDYLEMLNRMNIAEVKNLTQEIDEFNKLLMVNSGSLN